MSMLEAYRETDGGVLDHLRQLAGKLKGKRIVHVNSTRVGGGVAEILTKLVPLMRELELDARWEVIVGEGAFFDCTKSLHNALQGQRVKIPDELIEAYRQTNADNVEHLAPALEDADFVFIHDPQPAPLLEHFPGRKGRWIWRCHIDVSHPYRAAWSLMQPIVARYDASIFSLAAFARDLPHPQYLIAPSIDPLSDKNLDLPEDEVAAVRPRFGIDAARPMLLQVSRFDRFKDPVGVIAAYRRVKKFAPSLQLVLAGGSASDDPEGEAVLAEVRGAAQDDRDIHVLLLPPDAHRAINALQRSADIVVQKSIREGFGLTVTESLWKGKPVIGGDVGGIRLQVVDHHTGFLVSTPEGAALRIRYMLQRPEKVAEMAVKARSFVHEHFLITRHLREYLTLMVALEHAAESRIVLA